MRLSEEFNVAVVVLNQCMADPGAMSMFVSTTTAHIVLIFFLIFMCLTGSSCEASWGHVLAHASTTRLMLKKGKAEQRICKVYDRYIMQRYILLLLLLLLLFLFCCSTTVPSCQKLKRHSR